MTWEFMQLEDKSRPLTAEQVGGSGEWNPVINGTVYWYNPSAGIRATELTNGCLLLKFEAGHNGLEQAAYSCIDETNMADIAIETILQSAGFIKLDT
jgi:hypothetical protein